MAAFLLFVCLTLSANTGSLADFMFLLSLVTNPKEVLCSPSKQAGRSQRSHEGGALVGIFWIIMFPSMLWCCFDQ